jgi:hypothetical protein
MNIMVTRSKTQWDLNLARLRLTPEQFRVAALEGISRGAASFRKRLQETVKGNTLGWPGLATYTKTGAVIGATLRSGGHNASYSRNKAQNAARGQQLMGQLVRLLRYKVYEKDMYAKVGLIAEMTSVSTFDKFQQFQRGGVAFAVNDAMRKMFAAMGMPLRASTVQLRQPPRPLVHPAWERERQQVQEKIIAKMQQLIRGWIWNNKPIPAKYLEDRMAA